MNKRIDIIYNTNKQEWELERIAEKHGFTLTDNCYWVQIMRNQDGDSIVLTREDSELAHDPVGRLIAILETTETETTETETTETETVSNRRQYVATFMDGLDGAIRVEFLEATDEKHARYKAQHMAGMFETVENVREVDPDDLEKVSGVTVPRFVDVMTHDEISGTIDALKKAVAPIDDAMEVDNVSLEEWQEMSAKSAAVWEKIGLLQYVLYIPGVQRFQTERRFYNTESGDVLTLEDLLLCWSQHKCLREGWPRFGWYVAACQTYQGGTLEEIK